MAAGPQNSGERREPSFGASPEVRPDPADRPPAPAPRRRKSGKKKRKGARKARRSILGRIAYWGLVLALWGVIGAAGVVVWVGAHLPPIQSLEIPKRPPSIQIVDVNLHSLATRGDQG